MEKKLVWKIEVRRVEDLVAWSENPRKIKKADMERLMERIKQRGFHAVIVIDIDNTILSGSQRKAALLKLGVTEVNVLIPNRKLSEEERKKIALEDNLHDGQWDMEKLKAFEMDFLSDIGLSDLDLSKIWSDQLEAADDNFDETEELAKIKIPQTKLGDLVILGNHKILCSDSTDTEAVKKLFGEDKASMVYSDSVYNLKTINYATGVGGKKNYGGVVNDNRTDAEYKEFLRKSMIGALAVSKDDVHFFYYSDQTYIGFIQELYRELGIENKRVCLWLKNSQNPVPGVAFNKCYEPCTYGVRGRPYIAPNIQNLNEVMNGDMTTGNNLMEQALDHLDIWAVKRLPGKDMEHATSKPPKLHEKAIRRCTKVGDIILDSFLGSASTLIAAEQLKRRVYGVELEPIYVDLAIRRFEKLTGVKAKIINKFYEK